MKITNYRFLLSILLVLIFCINVQSQITIKNVAEIPRIKKGTTFIMMKNPDSKQAEEFKAIYQKYWTFSKIEFIKFADIKKYLSAENSFIDIRGYKTEGTYESVATYKGNPASNEYSYMHFFLELWTCNEKYLNTQKGLFIPIDECKNMVA